MNKNKKQFDNLANVINKEINRFNVEKYDGFGNDISSASDVGRVRTDWKQGESGATSWNINVITNRALRSTHSNTWIQAAVRTLRIGILSAEGPIPRPRLRLPDGKIDKKLNAKVKKYWDRFNDQVHFLPVRESFNLMMNTLIVTGNCFIVRVKEDGDSENEFSFRIEIFGTQHLDFSHDTPIKDKEGKFTQFGISFNKSGKPQKYFFKDGNTFDAKDVIHIFIPEMAQQKIGISWLAPALPILYDVEQMLQNQNLTSRVMAGLMIWMKKEDNDNFNPEDDMIPMSPLNIIRTFTKPEVIEGSGKVTEEIIPLIEIDLKAITASLGISYSSVSRDLSGESFSGGRMRNMSDEITFDNYFKIISKIMLQKIYNWFFEDIVFTKKLKEISITDYLADKFSFRECFFYRKPVAYVDPLDNIRTDIEQRNAGLITENELMELQGKDLEEHYEQLAKEKEMREKLGIYNRPDQEGKITENIDSKLKNEANNDKNNMKNNDKSNLKKGKK